MCHKFFIVILIVLVSTQMSQAASYVTKCKSNDAKCMRASAVALIPTFAAGIPELNVAPMDPLVLESMDASSKGLKLLLTDTSVTGLRDCDVQRVERDVAKSRLHMTVLCDVEVKGQYEIDGHVLILPIQGKGDAYVHLKKLLLNVDGDLSEKTDKKGVKHWDIKSFRHTFDLKDTAKIRLENLFNGNQQLADAVNNLFNTSPNDVVKEVGDPIVKAIITKVVKNVDHFFHKLPAEELSID